MAVGQGFEPREPRGSTVFKTAAFDHSASPPKLMLFAYKTSCKYLILQALQKRIALYRSTRHVQADRYDFIVLLLSCFLLRFLQGLLLLRKPHLYLLFL